MIKLFATFVPFCALLLAACAPEPATPALRGTDFAGATIGGPFELSDPQGKTVRWDDFAGRYRIVYFGYAWCPDVCPLDVRTLMQGFARFEREHPDRAAKVQPIFITVDPARDTPAKVAEFTAAFHPRLLGLTGTETQIAAAAKAFRAYYSKLPPRPDGQYDMDHTRLAYLMDPAGKPIEGLPIEQGADAVAADLAIAVK